LIQWPFGLAVLGVPKAQPLYQVIIMLTLQLMLRFVRLSVCLSVCDGDVLWLNGSYWFLV